MRDRRGLGGERRGERVVEALDVLVLLRRRDAGVVHAVAQRLQQRRQAADDLGALLARDLGAGRPDQVGGGALHRPWWHRSGRRDLTAVVASTSAQTWNRNSRTPSCTGTSLSILRSSIVYWIASVSRCSTCWASETPLLRGLVLVAEVVLEEFLELGQHGLEDAPAGVGIGLDDLDDALDLLLEQRRRRRAPPTSKPITQTPMRSIRRRAGWSTVAKKSGSDDRHPQHRHLQAREPDPHRRRDALFGQDALEQQRDDLDRGALDRRRGGLLQRLLALVQLLQQHRRADAGAPAPRRAGAASAPRDALLRLG